MERMTIPDYFYSDCEFMDSGIAEYLNRLAAYEDTGLEPEDITNHFGEATVMKLAAQALGATPERLRELAQADREGRLLITRNPLFISEEAEAALGGGGDE